MKSLRWTALALVLVAGASAPCAAAEPVPSSPEGTWRGVLNGQLHLVLSITRNGSGLGGVLDSVDQNAKLPIETVTVDKRQVRFEIPRVHGVFEGTLDADGKVLAGTWTQGVGSPLTFTRDSSAQPAAARKPAAPRPPLDVPIDVTVPTPPTAVAADGKVHLVYELHVTNFGSRELTLDTLETLDDDSHAPLQRLAGAELSGAITRPGATEPAEPDKLRLAPGQRAVVFAWTTVDAAKVPAALAHRWTVRVGDQPMRVSSARLPVRKELAVIAPPLRGAGWVAGSGPSNSSRHRRALIPVGGHAALSERFAIDWVRLRPDGKDTFEGKAGDNRSYRAYGAEALAVADGAVVRTKDGIPQNVPGPDSRAVPMTLETLGGNYVIVDLGQGRFAFYGHLQPGSLRVKVGDHVRQGQVLGLVGNSGNSTEPHLHFHLSDSPSPLGSEGLPYVFSTFDERPEPDAPPRRHRMEIPSENELVDFP
jgi:murein DD-endopeptidase MepM/ murein hydrolase activator NlpD